MKRLWSIGFAIVVLGFSIYFAKNFFTKKDLFNFASSLPLESFEDARSIQIIKGFRDYFEHKKIHNIKLTIYKDKNIQKNTFKNIEKIYLNEKIDAFIFPMLHISYKNIKRYDKPWVFPNDNDILKRYKNELKLIINDIVKNKKIKKVSLFYENNQFGRFFEKDLNLLLEKFDLDICSIGSYKPNTLSLGQALYEIVPTRPKAIILLSPSKAAVNFIKRACQTNLQESYFYILSYTDFESFIKRLDRKLLDKVIFVLRDTKNIKIPQIKNSYIEGYVEAKVLDEVIKKYSRFDPDRIDWEKLYLKEYSKCYLSKYQNNNFVRLGSENP